LYQIGFVLSVAVEQSSCQKQVYCADMRLDDLLATEAQWIGIFSGRRRRWWCLAQM
jgi:hypothetical protein